MIEGRCRNHSTTGDRARRTTHAAAPSLLAWTSSGPGRNAGHTPIGSRRQGAAYGHLQRVGRHLENKRDPGQCRERTEQRRAGRAGDQDQVGEAPKIGGQGYAGDGPAAAPLPACAWLTVPCHRFVTPAGPCRGSPDSLGRAQLKSGPPPGLARGRAICGAATIGAVCTCSGAGYTGRAV